MIFLSYAKEDNERASKIFSLLNLDRPDRPVFYDKDALLPGMDWRYEIEEKVRQCSLVLILCSASSISKEGFVQREIRLALDRAEMMPDGRIFIIPIRFDNVQIPAKLAKYQWLDVVDDADLFDIQFFVDLAWDRLTGATRVDAEVPPVPGIALTPYLLREKVVILLRGLNLQGEQIYSYVKLPLWKLQELRKTMRAKANFSAADYGVILERGKGEPPPELVERMAREHNMIDVPRTLDAEREALAQLQEVFATAFAEAYRSIMGADAAVPLVQLPLPIPEGSSALREGLKQGLAAAQSKL